MAVGGMILGGRYRLLEILGDGGTARVFRAQDERLGRIVAVKILHQQYLGQPDFVRRFQQEAQLAAGLTHPNIVSIYDVDRDDDTYYIVMEYVEGGSLKRLIVRDAPLPLSTVIPLMRELGQALDVAHGRGIIHRDIKPENILLTPDHTVKVSDFGIARALTTAGQTATGMVLGSVSYFSPEQAQGQPATAESDLYSSGIVLYEMLTGRLPFTAGNPLATAMQHITQEPAPPRSVVPSLPPAVDTVVLKAIDKNPARRYHSGVALAAALAAIVAAPPARDNTTIVASRAATAVYPAHAPAAAPMRGPRPAGPRAAAAAAPQRRRAPVLPLLLLLLLGGGGAYAYTHPSWLPSLFGGGGPTAAPVANTPTTPPPSPTASAVTASTTAGATTATGGSRGGTGPGPILPTATSATGTTTPSVGAASPTFTGAGSPTAPGAVAGSPTPSGTATGTAAAASATASAASSTQTPSETVSPTTSATARAKNAGASRHGRGTATITTGTGYSSGPDGGFAATDPRDRFTPNAQAYAVLHLHNVPVEASIAAMWTFPGGKHVPYPLGSAALSSPSFWVQQPVAGPGAYSVSALVDGKTVGTRHFSVSTEAAGAGTSQGASTQAGQAGQPVQIYPVGAQGQGKHNGRDKGHGNGKGSNGGDGGNSGNGGNGGDSAPNAPAEMFGVAGSGAPVV